MMSKGYNATGVHVGLSVEVIIIIILVYCVVGKTQQITENTNTRNEGRIISN